MGAARLRVRDLDRGAGRLRAALGELAEGVELSVGVHADTGALDHRGPSDATVAQVAAGREFGNARNAPSSFLRSTVDEQRARIETSLSAAARRAVKSAIYGSSPEGHVERAFGRVATRWAKTVQRKIRKLKLKDTGQLLESIDGRVNGERVDSGAE